MQSAFVLTMIATGWVGFAFSHGQASSEEGETDVSLLQYTLDMQATSPTCPTGCDRCFVEGECDIHHSLPLQGAAAQAACEDDDGVWCGGAQATTPQVVTIGEGVRCSDEGARDMTQAECEAYAADQGSSVGEVDLGSDDQSGCMRWPGEYFQYMQAPVAAACPGDGAQCFCTVEETASDPRGDFAPPWNDNPNWVTDWDAWCAFEMNEGCYACENKEGAGTLCINECNAAGCQAVVDTTAVDANADADKAAADQAVEECAMPCHLHYTSDGMPFPEGTVICYDGAEGECKEPSASGECPKYWTKCRQKLSDYDYDAEAEDTIVADTVCRADESDDTINGRGTTCLPPNKPCPKGHTMESCKALCESTAGCTGYEFKAENGRCEPWSVEIGYFKPSAGYTCVSLSGR